MLDHHVAASATIAKPVPISPDKAALKYLEASGAAPIFVTEVDGVTTIRTGSKVDPRAAVVFWIAGQDAKSIVKVARRIAGKPKRRRRGRVAAEGRRRVQGDVDAAWCRYLTRQGRSRTPRRIHVIDARLGRAQGIYAHL